MQAKKLVPRQERARPKTALLKNVQKIRQIQQQNQRVASQSALEQQRRENIRLRLRINSALLHRAIREGKATEIFQNRKSISNMPFIEYYRDNAAQEQSLNDEVNQNFPCQNDDEDVNESLHTQTYSFCQNTKNGALRGHKKHKTSFNDSRPDRTLIGKLNISGNSEAAVTRPSAKAHDQHQSNAKKKRVQSAYANQKKHLVSTPKKGRESGRPMWALTEAEARAKEAMEEQKAENLIQFMDNLNFDEYQKRFDDFNQIEEHELEDEQCNGHEAEASVPDKAASDGESEIGPAAAAEKCNLDDAEERKYLKNSNDSLERTTSGNNSEMRRELSRRRVPACRHSHTNSMMTSRERIAREAEGHQSASKKDWTFYKSLVEMDDIKTQKRAADKLLGQCKDIARVHSNKSVRTLLMNKLGVQNTAKFLKN